MNRKGGYQIIDLKGNDLIGASFTISGIYDVLEGNYNKAILLSGIVIGGVEYDDVFTTPKVVSSKYVLDAYGYTLTIDDDDLVTMGEVQTLFENIVDKDGHYRFIEGNGVVNEETGFESSYCRWSLSGSHLMVVLAYSFDNYSIVSGTTFATFELPQWIADKITPAFRSTYIEIKQFTAYANDLGKQDFNASLIKVDNELYINAQSTIAITGERFGRIQFDLIIDNE